MTYVVGFYEIGLEYGGPEEGGWWYDTGGLERLFFVTKSREEAYEKAFRANLLLATLQHNLPEVSSVLYTGGRYRAKVFIDKAPEYFPVNRPMYDDNE